MSAEEAEPDNRSTPGAPGRFNGIVDTPARPDPDSLHLAHVDGDGIDAYLDAVTRGFHETLDDQTRALWHRHVQPERTFGFREGERWVATMAAYDRRLTVPGGEVGVAAVSEVTVSPAFRRRRLLSRMMQHQLEDARDRGEAAAYLWVSEAAIYGRFGYGEATRRLTLEVDTRRSAFQARVDLGDGWADEVERATFRAAAVPVFEGLRPRTPGWLDRPEQWWDAATFDAESVRAGAGPLRYVLHWDRTGAVTGYALFRTKEDYGPDGNRSHVLVREVVATTGPARARLWRLLLDLDLMPTLRTRFGGLGESLPWWLADRDAVTERLRSGTFLRVVDVPGALGARRWAQEVDLVLEVRDDLLPDNAGRFRIRGGPEGSEAARTDTSADLVLDVRELGTAYLGGTSLQTLARAGLVHGEDPGTLARASRAFGWAADAECLDMF